jgi:uncharacterized coiled-coil protein SlyX
VRRGPAPGKAAELRRTIEKLQEKIHEQKMHNKRLQEQHASLLNKMERNDLSTGGHLVNTTTLNTYVNIYLDKAISFMQVSPPYQDINDYYRESDVRSILMSAVFGIGALVVGNKQHSNMFIKVIEGKLRAAFDDINPYICAVHYLLSGYYGSSGDPVREMSYNARALLMANILRKKLKGPIVGLDMGIIQKHSWIKQSLHAENLDMLEDDVNSVLNESSDQLSWTIAQLEHNALHWEVKAVNELDPNFTQSTNLKRLVTVVNLAESLTHQVPQPVQTMLLMRVLSARLVLYMFIGQDDIAHQIALQIMSLASTPSAILVNNPYFVHVPLLLVGQFFLLTGVQSPDFQKLLQVLSKVDTLNVVRGLLLKERPIINPQDDMVAWSYFYPRLDAFRELNMKALTLHYGADQRTGVYVQDQPYVHSIEHGSEFFAHSHDGIHPTYYNTHEEYGHDYAHSYVQPNYHLEPDSP